MIDGLKPYAASRDSGVPWLGELPAHWPALRLKTLVSNVVHQAERVLPDDYYIALEHVESWTGRIKESSAAAVEGQVKRFRAGDLLFGKLRPYLAKVARPSRPGVCVGEFLVLRPTIAEISGAYLEYLLRSAPFIAVVNSSTFGAKMPRADWAFVGSLRVPYPPLDEQAAIVRFLDHVDRRIRRYIRAKKKLIALLNERKQAIVHRAVTSGLDPNVRLKPSGVEWLGDIPEPWEVVRLGRVIDLLTGFPFKSDGFTHDENDIRLLRGINIAPGSIRWDSVVRWPTSEVELYKEFQLQPGDIVLGMDRPLIQSGTRVAVVRESDLPALLLQRVARIRVKARELLADWLLLLLSGKSFAQYLAPIFTGISVPHVSPEQIKSFRLTLPALPTQRAITQRIAAETAGIESAIARASMEIELLREYRSRMIADIVTGKLDVRDAVAHLPDEPAGVSPWNAETEDTADDVANVGELVAAEAEA